MALFKALLVAVAALLLSPAAFAADTPTLTVYTYQSFASDYGPGPAIKKGFEAECGCTVAFVPVDSAIGALRRIQLEGATTSADVLVVKTRDPNIVFGAAPNPPPGWLELDPNRRYFFNMIFAVYNKTAGAWNATCTDAGDPCKSGFTRYVTQ